MATYQAFTADRQRPYAVGDVHENRRQAIADAGAYHERTGRHAVVQRVEEVYTTQTISEVM